jgi:hypothetical protein
MWQERYWLRESKILSVDNASDWFSREADRDMVSWKLGKEEAEKRYRKLNLLLLFFPVQPGSKIRENAYFGVNCCQHLFNAGV